MGQEDIKNKDDNNNNNVYNNFKQFFCDKIRNKKCLNSNYDDHHVISRGARGCLQDDNNDDVYSNP